MPRLFDPRTKTSIIQGFMCAGEWRKALAAAARLPQLGRHRNAVLDGHGAYTNPRFYAQIGKSPEALIEAGVAALNDKFGARG